MINFSEDDIRAIREQTEKSCEAMSEDKSVCEVLAELYVSGLADKTKEQGEMMADHVIQIVSEYTQACNQAMENPEEWMCTKLCEILKDKTLEERCQILFQLANAFNAVNATALKNQMSDAGVNTDAIIAELEGKKLDASSVSETMEAELRTQVLQSMNGCGLLLSQLDTLADMIENLSDQSGITRCVVNYGIKTADYKAIAAMTAYISSKNGTLDSIPPDVTLEEITVGVCASIEAQRIANEVESGKLGEEAARMAIKILGLVAAAFLVFKLAMLGFVFGTLLASSVFGVICGVLLGTAVTFTLGNVIINFADKATDQISDFTIAATRGVANGLRKLAGWVCGTVVPSAVKAAKSFAAFVAGLLRDGAVKSNVTHTETVSNNV